MVVNGIYQIIFCSIRGKPHKTLVIRSDNQTRRLSSYCYSEITRPKVTVNKHVMDAPG